MVSKKEAEGILKRFIESKPANLMKKLGDIDAGMGFILVYLSHAKEDVYANEISQKMDISRSRVAVLLKKLEGKELIEKYASTQDARIEVLKLTKYGQKFVENMKEKVLDATIKIIEEVGLENINTFIDISEKIKMAIGKN